MRLSHLRPAKGEIWGEAGHHSPRSWSMSRIFVCAIFISLNVSPFSLLYHCASDLSTSPSSSAPAFLNLVMSSQVRIRANSWGGRGGGGEGLRGRKGGMGRMSGRGRHLVVDLSVAVVVGDVHEVVDPLPRHSDIERKQRVGALLPRGNEGVGQRGGRRKREMREM